MNEQPKIVCLKIGGRAATDVSAMETLVEEIAELSRECSFVVVHGGGVEVTRLSETLGFTPTFSDGVRMTSPEEMDIVDMVLSGKINKSLVRHFHAAGVRAAGLSGNDGSLFTGTRLSEQTHTGTIKRVDPALLRLLLEHQFLPVIASTSMTDAGIPLNINADEVAFAIAGKLPANILAFLSDIPGVLAQNGELLPLLDEESVTRNIANGTITGGMIPKMRASIDALRAGVGRIAVGRFAAAGDLKGLLHGDIGTRVVLGNDSEPCNRR